MSYDEIHRSNERFLLLVFAILMVAFVVALVLMFVHPTGSLFVFFGGLLFAGVAWVIERFYLSAEHKAAAKEHGGGEVHAGD